MVTLLGQGLVAWALLLGVARADGHPLCQASPLPSWLSPSITVTWHMGMFLLNILWVEWLSARGGVSVGL